MTFQSATVSTWPSQTWRSSGSVGGSPASAYSWIQRFRGRPAPGRAPPRVSVGASVDRSETGAGARSDAVFEFRPDFRGVDRVETACPARFGAIFENPPKKRGTPEIRAKCRAAVIRDLQ